MTTANTIHLPPELQAGKDATRSLIKRAGGQEYAEELTGRSQARFSAYGLKNTDAFIPIDLVRALEGVTHGQPGHPHVTRWLSGEAGYLLVRKPSRGGGSGDLHHELAAVSKETSDVVQRVLEALRDGSVSARAIAELKIRAEISEAQEQLATLDAVLAQIEAEG